MNEDKVTIFWDGSPFLEALEDIVKAIRAPKKEEIPQWKVQLSSGLITIGNTSVAALFFQQMFQNSVFNLPAALGGFFLFVVFYFIAILLLKGKE